MLNANTRYLNFEPTDGFQLYADSLITRLMELAPYDSIQFSAIEKQGKVYTCMIEIVSLIGRFKARIEAADPKSALEESRRRIIRQLSKWHRSRFQFNTMVTA